MSFDQHSISGRARIDEAVTAHLATLAAGASRREIAAAVGLDDAVASAALKRLVQQGKAERTGERSQTRYAAPKPAKKSAKK
jgi:predicted transcriptional regulator